MKRILFSFLILWPFMARAQDSINPYNIGQPGNIILQNTDVYYAPYPVPGDSDTRVGLSSESDIMLDSNGVGSPYRDYLPVVYDTFITPHQYVYLKDFHLPGYQPLGRYVGWERLFTARRKADGSPSDIIAGSNVSSDTTRNHGVNGVIVSKNEDVDFRASGTVKLENGFHVMPGSFFHAYQEPKWGDSVLSDDFNDSTIDRSKWYVVTNGTNAESGGQQCLYDSNVYIDTDYQATDGKALDIMMREDTNGFSSKRLQYPLTCADLPSLDTTSYRNIFSSALVRACPWPLAGRATPPDSIVYPHMPYGKFEVREKVPAFIHHTNNWTYGADSYEIDMCEGTAGWQDTHGRMLNVHHNLQYGPFTGRFYTSPDTVFVSTGADWSLVNNPGALIIDGFAYNVQLAPGHKKDSVIGTDPLCWPASLLSGNTITFYYSRSGYNIADTVPWKITQDPATLQWRIFSAPYKIISPGDSARFTKDYQPTSITLHADPSHPQNTIIFRCHWAKWLNSSGDTGRLWMDDYDTAGSYFHSRNEPYSYTVEEGFNDYPSPYMALEWGDSTPSSYQYHTYGAEVQPHEIRIMLDSNVILRYPDRLVPPTNREFDFTSKLGRSWAKFYIGEFDMDLGTFAEDKASFEYAASHLPWAGFWPMTIAGQTYPAAHDLIDYVRVWDVPSDMTIGNFPH